MKLAIITSGSTEWAEVHRAGCNDLNKRSGIYGSKNDHAWHIDVDTKADAILEIGSDFLYEGSMTYEDCKSSVRFAPCLNDLPSGE